MRALLCGLILSALLALGCGEEIADAPAADDGESPQAIVQLTREWAAAARSVEMQIDVEVQLFGAPSRFGMTVAAQGSNSYAVVSLPAQAGQEGERERLEILTRGGETFTRDAAEADWVDVGEEEFWLAGIDLELLTGAAVFDWSALDGVVVTEGVRAGVEVWVVEYVFELSDIEAEEQGIGGALGPAAALLLRSFDLPTELIGAIEVRSEIARASGAPLFSEVAVALDGPGGVAADRAVVATTELRGWNEEIELLEVNNTQSR